MNISRIALVFLAIGSVPAIGADAPPATEAADAEARRFWRRAAASSGLTSLLR